MQQVLELVALILNCRTKQGSHHKGPPHLTQKAVLCGIGQCLFGSSTCDGATRIVPVIMQENRKNSFSCASHSTRRKHRGSRNAPPKNQSAYNAHCVLKPFTWFWGDLNLDGSASIAGAGPAVSACRVAVPVAVNNALQNVL